MYSYNPVTSASLTVNLAFALTKLPPAWVHVIGILSYRAAGVLLGEGGGVINSPFDAVDCVTPRRAVMDQLAEEIGRCSGICWRDACPSARVGLCSICILCCLLVYIIHLWAP